MKREDFVGVDGQPCKDCGIWKPWSEFSADARRVSGYISYCRRCQTARVSASRRKHADKIRAYNKRYVALHREELKARQKRWRDRNRETLRKREQRRYALGLKTRYCDLPEDQKDKQRARARAWLAAHPGYSAAYYWRNRAAILDRSRAYYQRNREAILAKRRGY